MKKKVAAGWVYVPLPVSFCGELAGERIDVVEQRMEHVGGAGSGAGGADSAAKISQPVEAKKRTSRSRRELPNKPAPARLWGAAGARCATKVKTRCDEDSLG